MTHPAFTLLAAVLLSLAMAAVEDRTSRERLYVAARVFLCCVASTVGGGWLMHFIHG